MSIDNILEKIARDSEAEAEKVLQRAGGEAGGIRARYESRASELEEQLRARAEGKAAEEKRRLIVSEQLELRKAALVRKREILANLYEEAKKRIASLSGDEYLSILSALILSKAISGREEIVPASGQSGVLAAGLLAGLNKKYPGGGKFTIAEQEGAFEWGVVLREGKRTVDLSLETVFDQVMERIEPEVSAILFQL
jgi:vacuolar-type H+-ATPase subunit E/Vma4